MPNRDLFSDLEEHVAIYEKGGGFGDPDAEKSHKLKIEHLRFQIERRDKFKIALMSALIGSAFGAISTLVFKFVFG